MLKLIAKTVLTAVVAGGLCVGGVARADEMSSIDPIYKKQPPTQMPTQQTPTQYVKPQPKPMPVYQQQYVKPYGKQSVQPMPMPIPPHGGRPYSTARRKSSSIGCASTSPAARLAACSSKRCRWSTGSVSSVKALAYSRPRMISSNRSTNRGS